MELKSTYRQHAIKNSWRKVVNLNDIINIKWLSNLIGRCFEMPTFLIASR